MSEESKRRLLIVLESKSIEEILKKELQPEYNITFNYKGHDAIEIVKQEQDVDLVILGTKFEDNIYWRDVSEEIRIVDKGMPIIIYTASEEYGNIPYMFEIKAYILHPNTDKLKIKIKEALEIE